MNKYLNSLSLFLSLFTSASTLVCCALPSLFVILGAGAVFAGLTSTFPQLIWLSEHKTSLFIVAGILLLLSGYGEHKNRNKSCDYAHKEACNQTRSLVTRLWKVSLILYGIGLFFAFILPVLYTLIT